MGPDDGTTRERILRLLLEARRPLSAREIAASLGLDPVRSEREIYEHIRHIAKTLRRRYGGRYTVYMVPPRCRNCGYVFTDLAEARRPSRCPRCKSQRIAPPLFYVEES